MTQLNQLMVIERRRDLIRAAEQASVSRDLDRGGRTPKRQAGRWRAAR
ncbi:MAG TPA: hypothetical protein VIJ51_08405 [Solirubrobacteraceae bacterium]